MHSQYVQQSLLLFYFPTSLNFDSLSSYSLTNCMFHARQKVLAHVHAEIFPSLLPREKQMDLMTTLATTFMLICLAGITGVCLLNSNPFFLLLDAQENLGSGGPGPMSGSLCQCHLSMSLEIVLCRLYWPIAYCRLHNNVACSMQSVAKYLTKTCSHKSPIWISGGRHGRESSQQSGTFICAISTVSQS